VKLRTSGVQVRDFDKSWAAACKKAECEGCLFHDLRRSAARNLIRSGVAQAVAMCITGHETDAMFRRYNITSEADLRDAMQRVTKYNKAEQQKVVSIAKCASAATVFSVPTFLPTVAL
jgi:Phage integrase family.